jgi:hypothetical protein
MKRWIRGRGEGEVFTHPQCLEAGVFLKAAVFVISETPL